MIAPVAPALGYQGPVMQVRQTTPPFLLKIEWHTKPSAPGRQAETMPPGRGRDALTERTREVETAAQISERLRSSRSKLPRRAVFRAKGAIIATIHRPVDKPSNFAQR